MRTRILFFTNHKTIDEKRDNYFPLTQRKKKKVVWQWKENPFLTLISIEIHFRATFLICNFPFSSALQISFSICITRKIRSHIHPFNNITFSFEIWFFGHTETNRKLLRMFSCECVFRVGAGIQKVNQQQQSCIPWNALSLPHVFCLPTGGPRERERKRG